MLNSFGTELEILENAELKDISVKVKDTAGDHSSSTHTLKKVSLNIFLIYNTKCTFKEIS